MCGVKKKITESEDDVIKVYKQQSEDIRMLSYKIMVDTLNEKYKVLDQNQKRLLREFINNITNTNSLNLLINEEVESVKKEFSDYEVLNKFSPKWLGKQHFDIFIPKLKIAIEYQGGQHFKPVKFFGGEKGYEKVLKRDETKRKKCIMKGIKLYYFSYDTSYVPKKYEFKVHNCEKELFNNIKLDL